MKKIILLILTCQTLLFFQIQIKAGELKVTTGNLNETYNLKKAYFAGGCFWCMEESFDKVDGVIKSISGYSGGHLKNPTYEDVIYKDTGHVETIEITYDPKKISYKKLLNIFWKNIDPFDKYGQFCDKGKSYRSVIFFENNKQKNIIQKSTDEVEQKFNTKVVTLLWKFDKFYEAENYHQDYYQKNFLRYLAYKKACQREEVLNKIWN
jgi:peptide-methionine (S)-S-oxide reductase|tara:strand:+ start:1558 stop:2181 length:624 start_codon:yes stop_codon:yes gene_type:complete